jgi:putative ATP-dependent endonuclease of OLD family
LAILQTYADFRRSGEASGKRFLFLIDEAELHLHPTAQRNLKIALKDISDGGDQVFINTHSSVLVADDSPVQKIFRVEKTNKKSSVTYIDQAGKPSLVYELLGGSPSDLLLPRNFLIVEGKSDQIFIDALIRRFYADKPAIQIVFSEGDFEKQRESMNAINTVLAPLAKTSLFRDRLIILCDAPRPQKQAGFEKFVAAYPYLTAQNQLYVLPFASLEEYYGGQYRKTSSEVEDLGKEMGLKREVARHVGKNITQQEFEHEMEVIFNALTMCWNQAYQ